MIFNSFQFAIFFTIVFLLYIILNRRWQNLFLLAASYYFYACWNWRYLPLIAISTFITYLAAIKIGESDTKAWKKLWLILCLVVDLGILGFFKYYNFFVSNAIAALRHLVSPNMEFHFLQILLPVGVSFYTFQLLGYAIDVYRGQVKATRRLLDFSLFAAFFPQLLAGPIGRAKDLFPQYLAARKISLEGFYEGGWLIFFGLFQKVYIADNLANIVRQIFWSNGMGNGAMVLLGSYAFAFQIYCDFAGYSNMAIGLAKLLGFDLMVNFRFPYFAVNPSDFWRRWHISLSTWLRDYLYIPLGGNRKGTAATYRNLLVTMFLGGLWHGASWLFLLWGLYHGILLVVHRITNAALEAAGRIKLLFRSRFFTFIAAVVTFHLICLGWLIFRAESFAQAWGMTKSIFSNFNIAHGIGIRSTALKIFSLVWLLGLLEVFQHRKNDLFVVFKWPASIRYILYVVIFLLIILYGDFGEKEFIYFKF